MKINPIPLAETWQGMEELVESGLARNIGICNYNSGLLHDLMAYSNIKPAILQIESHPYLTQNNLITQAKDYNISVTAFSPLGSLSYVELGMASENDSILNRREVLEIAEEIGRTPAQTVLRWGVQRGNAIIPKTVKPKRLKENIDLFNFSLSGRQMELITSLNCNQRFNDPAVFCKSEFGKFCSIYD